MALKQKLQDAAVAVAEAKARLIEAERVYDALYKQVASGKKPKFSMTVSIPPEQIAALESPSASNFTDRVMALLLSTPGKEWVNADIMKNLADIPTTTVPSLLYRLKKTGKVIKMGHGKWKAA